MELSVQIQSLVFSFVYGFIVSYVINLCYHHLFYGKLVYQIIWNFVVVVGVCLLYFISMKAINNVVLHPYFYLLVLIGYLVGNIFSFKIRYK